MSQNQKTGLAPVVGLTTSVACPIMNKRVTCPECQSQCVVPIKNAEICSEKNCSSQFRLCVDCVLHGKGDKSGLVVDPISGKCKECNRKVERAAEKLVVPELLPRQVLPVAAEKKGFRNRILLLDPSEIDPMDGQPRIYFDPKEQKSLTESIKEQNQFDEVRVVRKNDGRYRLIDGERRWRSCGALGEKVEAIVDEPLGEGDLGEALDFERSVTLNLHRSSHTPFEKALAMDRLRKPPLNRNLKQLSIRFGCTEMTVRNHLMLLDKLHPKVLDMMRPEEGKKLLGHTAALFLTSLADHPEEQLRVARQVVEKGADAVEGKLMVIKEAKKLGINVGRGLEKNRKPSDRISNLKNGIRRANIALEGFRAKSSAEIADFFKTSPSKVRDEVLEMCSEAMNGLAAVIEGLRLAKKRAKEK